MLAAAKCSARASSTERRLSHATACPWLTRSTARSHDSARSHSLAKLMTLFSSSPSNTPHGKVLSMTSIAAPCRELLTSPLRLQPPGRRDPPTRRRETPTPPRRPSPACDRRPLARVLAVVQLIDAGRPLVGWCRRLRSSTDVREQREPSEPIRSDIEEPEPFDRLSAPTQ